MLRTSESARSQALRVVVASEYIHALGERASGKGGPGKELALLLSIGQKLLSWTGSSAPRRILHSRTDALQVSGSGGYRNDPNIRKGPIAGSRSCR